VSPEDLLSNAPILMVLKPILENEVSSLEHFVTSPREQGWKPQPFSLPREAGDC
jgi:hypothetical protein